jgi:hypothetical protein
MFHGPKAASVTSGRVGAVLAALGVMFAEGAWANHCANPCGVLPNDLCVSWMVVGKGYRRTRRYELGETVRVEASQQRGTCGGSQPVTDANRTVSVSRDLNPGTAITTTTGQGALWTPTAPGLYFITVASKDSHVDHSVALVLASAAAEAPLRFSLPSSLRDGVLTLRLTPALADAAVHAGFGRDRWPVIFEDAAPLENPISVPANDYELSLVAHEKQKLVLAAAHVKAFGTTTVTLPAQRLAIEAHIGPGQRRVIALTSSDGAQVVACISGSTEPTNIEWHAAAGDATLACGPTLDGAPCVLPTARVAATTSVKSNVHDASWPKACE